MKFLLVGIDCDGETREFNYSTIKQARQTARNCSCHDASGPAWRSWEIWGNDPVTDEWRALESGTNNDFPQQKPGCGHLTFGSGVRVHGPFLPCARIFESKSQ